MSAMTFWDTELAVNGFGHWKVLSFDEAYEDCGGNTFLLHEMCKGFILSGMRPKESPYVYQARTKSGPK